MKKVHRRGTVSKSLSSRAPLRSLTTHGPDTRDAPVTTRTTLGGSAPDAQQG